MFVKYVCNFVSNKKLNKMRKNKFNLLSIVFATLVVILFSYSCSKDDSTQSLEKLEVRSSINLTHQDVDFRDLARVLSIGVKENLSLRTLIKREALFKYDGDYDILLNKIKNEQLSTNSGQQTVSAYLGSIYSRLGLSPILHGEGVDTTGVGSVSVFPTIIIYTPSYPNGIPQISNPSDIILYLVSVYPDIQISIPVHANDWDVSTYIPICTYVPEDYNEPTTLTVEGFDNGISVTVDAVNEPNDPVVVVSNSERRLQQVSLVNPPDVSIQLTASQSAFGINLSWTVTNPNSDEIIGYRIYKKSLISNSFVAVADNMDKDNKTYNDIVVNPNENYA